MSIFDLMTSQNLAAYWIELVQDMEPYPMEEKFPDKKKLGLSLQWLKGSKGLPVVLNNSAFDAAAIPRPRIGFEKLAAQMPFFKESKYIDEEMRQELNMVLETGNQTYIDTVMNRIFDDQTELLVAARAAREMMRCMAVTTGVISMVSNGQEFTYDYQIPAGNKVDAAAAWDDLDNSDPMEDIRLGKEYIMDNTGVEIKQAMCSGKVWRNLRNNKKIKESLFVLSNGLVGALSDARLRQYISDELGLDVVINDKRYSFVNPTNGDITQTRYCPDDVFVMFPEANLGSTWFGTTPEESDLNGATNAIDNVSIVDTGVAITTMRKADPVNVETKVTMICLPDLPLADQIYIIDTNA